MLSPNLQNDGWELESAVARHEAYPDRFDIPSQEERERLQPGDRVKLLFLLSGQDAEGSFVQCERMWVTVTQSDRMQYTGQLETLPRTSEALRPGDHLTFGPEHIATILVNPAAQ